jgi:hypothetical protein
LIAKLFLSSLFEMIFNLIYTDLIPIHQMNQADFSEDDAVIYLLFCKILKIIIQMKKIYFQTLDLNQLIQFNEHIHEIYSYF